MIKMKEKNKGFTLIEIPAAEGFTGETGISAHGYTDAFCFTGLILEPQSEASANVTAHLLGEVDVLTLDALQGNAANIAAVLQFLIIHYISSLVGIFSAKYYNIFHRKNQWFYRMIYALTISP